MRSITVEIKPPPRPTGRSSDFSITVQNADGDWCEFVPLHVYERVVEALQSKLRAQTAALYDIDAVLKKLCGLEPLPRSNTDDD